MIPYQDEIDRYKATWRVANELGLGEVPPQQLRVLNYLHSKIGEACSRRDLMVVVWPHNSPSEIRTRAVDMAVMRLRKILTAAKARVAVESVRGVGYRMVKIGDPR